MKTKSYKIQVTDNADGTSTVKRENVGFSAIELIGLLEATKASIIKDFTDVDIRYEHKDGKVEVNFDK